VKVVDRNHETRRQKPSQHVEMVATKSVTSPRQTHLCRSNGILTGLCRGHKSRKSSTQIMKLGDMICVADFHDCPRQSPRLWLSRKVGV